MNYSPFVFQNGDTILQSAINGKHPEIVKLILDRTVVDPMEKNMYGDNALHTGARRGNLEIVKLLLERTDIDPTEKNQRNNTAYDVVENYWIDSEEKRDTKEVIQSYMTKERRVSKTTTTVLEQDESPPEKSENVRGKIYYNTEHVGVNQDLLPFAGTSEDFHILLSTGTYESYENRVFLCGSCACGKSTLASVLIGSPIPLTWKSTDGLVIHFGRNGINLETYEMVPLKEEDRGHNVMTKLIIGKLNREILIRHSTDTKQELCIAPFSADCPESSLQVKKKNTSFSSKAFVSLEANIIQDKHLQDDKTTPSEVKKDRSISRPRLKKVESYAVHDDILKEIKSGQYKIKIAPSDLVDFGGQRSYDMTHQLFVQHGGTFVVMFDGSRDFQEPLTEYPTGDISNESIVKHWVNSILTYCVDDDDFMPKILFAATHSDLLSDVIYSFLASTGRSQTFEFNNKTEYQFDNHTWDYSKIQKASSKYLGDLGCKDPSVNESKSEVCQFLKNQEENFVFYSQIYNLFMLFWLVNFCIALGQMSLAGAFASYYWAFHKPKDVPTFPLMGSVWRSFRYHLGSLAFGSLIIAIIQIIRVLLEYVDGKLKGSENAVAKFFLKCMKCCFWCLEKFLRFLNKNAYIMIAAHGKNFCTSAKNAFMLIMRNCVR
ncbi:SLC44A2_4_5 [Mytilus edulis]|uniref:Choline transporter-like protein n=1 Tax=Mytilus edulis TaxID=6550 RepID=A0A8S3TCJ3_MYTED|nr:SLC44A2_4_5 [Mytilus edulis]